MATEPDFLRLISEATVPGLASAIIRDGRLDRYVCCGVRSAQLPDLIDENTVFEAASLTKPVFAHAVLQLADRGDLSLEAPLGQYLPDYIQNDDRASTITAKHVLTHSSGLPNWRNADFPLKTYFAPGERFSYSGEGFLYLQKAIEKITREKIHTLIDRLVFQPFGMTRSSFIWDFRFDQNRAYPHDAFGRPALGGKPGEANAAWSLQTTGTDFGRFLVSLLAAERFKPDTARAWQQPHVPVGHPGIQWLVPSHEPVATGVSWGLGWGLESELGTFFHWGDNGSFKAFTIGSMQRRCAVVIFMNGWSGLSIMPEVVAALMPGHRPSLNWLDYVRHDAPIRRLLRAARAEGIEAVWQEVQAASFGDDDLLWIAQGLVASGRDDDSDWLRARLKERAAT